MTLFDAGHKMLDPESSGATLVNWVKVFFQRQNLAEKPVAVAVVAELPRPAGSSRLIALTRSEVYQCVSQARRRLVWAASTHDVRGRPLNGANKIKDRRKNLLVANSTRTCRRKQTAK